MSSSPASRRLLKGIVWSLLGAAAYDFVRSQLGENQPPGFKGGLRLRWPTAGDEQSVTSGRGLPLVYIYEVPSDIFVPFADFHAGEAASVADRQAVLRKMQEDDMRVNWRECYATEWVIPAAWQRDGFVTSDPRNASAFLIPHMASAAYHECMGAVWGRWASVGNESERTAALQAGYSVCRGQVHAYLSRIVGWVRSNFPFFNPSSGADHAIIAGHDGGLTFFDGPDRSLMFGALQHVTVLQNLNSKLNEYYVPARTVVTMLFAHTLGLPADSAAKSGSLLFFAGGLHGRGRAAIHDAVQDDSDVLFIVGTDSDYKAHLAAAQFCLHLPGYAAVTWSGRIAHLIAAGCVPVIVMDDADMPFEASGVLSELLPSLAASRAAGIWQSFSVRISEAEAATPRALATRLRAISVARRQLMQEALLMLRPLLTYREPEIGWEPTRPQPRAREHSDTLENQTDAALPVLIELVASISRRKLIASMLPQQRDVEGA